MRLAVIVPVGISAALVGALGGWWAHGLRADTALAKVQLQHTQAHAALQAHALAEYKRMESTKDDAIKAAEQRAVQNRADADRAAVVVGRLQHDIARTPARIAAATQAAVDEYAATAGELLGACTTEYQWMAKQADGHAADARLMREVWPVARSE
jgi:hypothetical protein